MEQQTPKPLKLYEAIRLGAMLRPKTKVRLFYGGGSCAIGAAMEASGIPYNTKLSFEEAEKVFPQLLEISVRHPVDLFRSELKRIIWDLNDNCGWTREQIATWLEPIEEAYWAEKEKSQSAQIETPELVSA